MFIPWVLALLTAGWFWLAARKAARNPASWGLSGFVIGLVTATIVLGLGHATTNPFSDYQRHLLHFRWAAEAVVTIAVLGWFFTMPLHRHHLGVWRKLTHKASPPPPPTPSKQKSDPARQSAKR